MKIKKNSPKVWDNIWKNNILPEGDMLKSEKNKILFKRLKKIIIRKFGSIKNLKTIEIGAGTGTHSLLLASEGAHVTILDYSDSAINLSKRIFKKYNYKAKFIKIDALKINSHYLNKFDVAMSFGTAEHFIGKKRTKIIKTHFDLIKETGMVFITVPNKWNLLYVIHKNLSQFFGKWNFGEEYPFSPLEFIKIGKILKKKFYFTGSTIFSDPFCTTARIKKMVGLNTKQLPELGTFLDKYFARYFAAYSV